MKWFVFTAVAVNAIRKAVPHIFIFLEKILFAGYFIRGVIYS